MLSDIYYNRSCYYLFRLVDMPIVPRLFLPLHSCLRRKMPFVTFQLAAYASKNMLWNRHTFSILKIPYVQKTDNIIEYNLSRCTKWNIVVFGHSFIFLPRLYNYWTQYSGYSYALDTPYSNAFIPKSWDPC